MKHGVCLFGLRFDVSLFHRGALGGSTSLAFSLTRTSRPSLACPAAPSSLPRLARRWQGARQTGLMDGVEPRCPIWSPS